MFSVKKIVSFLFIFLLFTKSNILSKNKLLVLEELVKNNRQDFSHIDLFVIQHIKDNSIEFVKHLKKTGFRRITVIGKPYSVDLIAKKKMEEYASVIIPTMEDLESLNIIDDVLISNIKNNIKFFCLDLGGYFSKYFEKKNISPDSCLGIVEDTMNGIWFDELTYLPKRPLASVASSNIKDYVEHYFVAKAILRNIENILINSFQQTISMKNILICGYGRIGERIASILAKNSSTVYIHDIDSLRKLKAGIDGFHIFKKEDLGNMDLIIGITGNIVFDKELLRLKDGCFLVNGSTRKKEFDFDFIKKEINKKEKKDNYTKYIFNFGNSAYLLANGFPVNFWNTESTPEFCLDGVFSTIYLIMKKLVNKSYMQGYYPSERFFLEEEKMVANLWLEKYLK